MTYSESVHSTLGGKDFERSEQLWREIWSEQNLFPQWYASESYYDHTEGSETYGFLIVVNQSIALLCIPQRFRDLNGTVVRQKKQIG